jgi:hypothetical protein
MEDAVVSKDSSPSDDTPLRKQFLVHIDADLIRRTKILALERGVSASSIVQEALVELRASSQDAAKKP